MTVLKTGGGTFRCHDSPMYFAAGGQLEPDAKRMPPYLLVAVNELPTAQTEASILQPMLDAGLPVLLDSGIFWLTNEHKRAHGTTMDEALTLSPEEIDGFEELYGRYIQLVQRYGDRLWGYIELDQGGAANKRRTRARIERDAGVVPIPVYHPLNDGWDYFDELASGYDRVCVGNIVQASKPVRIRILHTLWERHRAHPGLWIHILGFTASELCLSMPFESCDSSSWISILRWNNTRTETGLMRRTKGLGLRFAYQTGSRVEGRAHEDGVRMCVDGIMGCNMVWRHAAARIQELAGQSAIPPRLPGEQLVTP